MPQKSEAPTYCYVMATTEEQLSEVKAYPIASALLRLECFSSVSKLITCLELTQVLQTVWGEL
jgi:hypothetical protein